MNIRLQLLGYRLHIGLTRLGEVTGVNSKVEEDGHFLMWDFDDVNFEVVGEELREAQRAFDLSTIYVLNTGIVNYYHAYCFTKVNWITARTIIASTPHVDKVFLAMGLMRGYFTLRFSAKRGRKLLWAATLISQTPETVNPESVKSFVKYMTKWQ